MLSVSSETDLVSSEIVGPGGGPPLVVLVSLGPESSVGLGGGGQTSGLPSLLLGAADPVDSRVVPDGGGRRVHHDDLVVFVGSVLGDPVGVQDAEGLQSTPDGLLGPRLQVLVHFESGDSRRLGLSVGDSLDQGPLSAASTDSGSVDHEALLLLVSQSTGPLDSRRAGDSVDGWQLSVLPGSESQDELHDFTFLLFPEFLKVFVCTHFIIYSQPTYDFTTNLYGR